MLTGQSAGSRKYFANRMPVIIWFLQHKSLSWMLYNHRSCPRRNPYKILQHEPNFTFQYSKSPTKTEMFGQVADVPHALVSDRTQDVGERLLGDSAASNNIELMESRLPQALKSDKPRLSVNVFNVGTSAIISSETTKWTTHAFASNLEFSFETTRLDFEVLTSTDNILTGICSIGNCACIFCAAKQSHFHIAFICAWLLKKRRSTGIMGVLSPQWAKQ